MGAENGVQTGKALDFLNLSPPLDLELWIYIFNSTPGLCTILLSWREVPTSVQRQKDRQQVLRAPPKNDSIIAPWSEIRERQRSMKSQTRRMVMYSATPGSRAELVIMPMGNAWIQRAAGTIGSLEVKAEGFVTRRPCCAGLWSVWLELEVLDWGAVAPSAGAPDH